MLPENPYDSLGNLHTSPGGIQDHNPARRLLLSSFINHADRVFQTMPNISDDGASVLQLLQLLYLLLGQGEMDRDARPIAGEYLDCFSGSVENDGATGCF